MITVPNEVTADYPPVFGPHASAVSAVAGRESKPNCRAADAAIDNSFVQSFSKGETPCGAAGERCQSAFEDISVLLDRHDSLNAAVGGCELVLGRRRVIPPSFHVDVLIIQIGDRVGARRGERERCQHEHRVQLPAIALMARPAI